MTNKLSKQETKPKYNGKHPGGRPPKYDNPETMEQVGMEYIKKCIDPNTGKFLTPLTISGLAQALGMDTETFCNYNKRDEFIGTIKKLRQFVEAFLEQRCHSPQATGAIFILCSKFGWKNAKFPELTKTYDDTIEQINKIINDKGE